MPWDQDWIKLLCSMQENWDEGRPGGDNPLWVDAATLLIFLTDVAYAWLSTVKRTRRGPDSVPDFPSREEQAMETIVNQFTKVLDALFRTRLQCFGELGWVS